jgi:hypothetical protein
MKSIQTIILSLLLTGSSWLSAQTDALSIIKKVDEQMASTTSIGKIAMLVFDDMHDKKNYRKMEVISYGKGEDESYMKFLSPKSIKGLSLLSKDGDQWVYFPSTGRVRKIAGKSKKKSVQGVGGDFSYEDLGGGKFEEKYTFDIEKNEDKQWIIKGTPKESDSSYNKILLYIEKDSHHVTKSEFFTPGYGHLKSLIQSGYKNISGKEIATRITMINHKKESKTMIVIIDAQYDVAIDDKYFNPTRFYK